MLLKKILISSVQIDFDLVEYTYPSISHVIFTNYLCVLSIADLS